MNTHRLFAGIMIGLLCLSHYMMAIVMYYEMDKTKKLDQYEANDALE
jgi:hypothetical protein